MNEPARPTAKKYIFYALLFLAIVFATRLLTVSQPLLGNFVSRQVPYAMAAEEYLKGAKLLYPQTYDLVNGKPTIMLLDFPLISVLAAGLHASSGIPVDASGRFVSALAALLAGFVLVFMVKKVLGFRTAVAAAALYSFSPLAIIYGQSFQADMLSAFFGIVSLYCAVKSGDAKLEKFWVLCAGLAYGVALSTRIHAGVLLLPITVFFFNHGGFKCLFGANFFLFLAAAFILPVPWYVHTFYAATHIDNIIWSNFHQSEVHGFPHPLLFKPEFYVQLAKILTVQLYTPVGFLLLVPAVVGILKKKDKEGIFILMWFLATLAPVVLLPRKIFDHNYYMVPAVFPGVCLAAMTFNSMFKDFSVKKFFLRAAYVFCLTLGLAAAWKPLWFIPAEERNIPAAAGIVQKMTPENAKVLFHGGPAFTYYSERYGWTFYPGRKKLSIWLSENVGNFKTEQEMDIMKKAAEDPATWLEYLKTNEGAAYFASSNLPELLTYPLFYQYLTSKYKVLYQDEKTVLFAL